MPIQPLSHPGTAILHVLTSNAILARIQPTSTCNMNLLFWKWKKEIFINYAEYINIRGIYLVESCINNLFCRLEHAFYACFLNPHTCIASMSFPSDFSVLYGDSLMCCIVMIGRRLLRCEICEISVSHVSYFFHSLVSVQFLGQIQEKWRENLMEKFNGITQVERDSK